MRTDTGPGHASLLRSVVRNAASQTGGRILLAMLRFGAAVIIARSAGIDVFGQYALVMSFVLVAEWVADFGQTDIAVRQIAADPSRRPSVLASLGRLKAAHGLVAAACLWGAVAWMGYPEPVVRASLYAAASIPLYAGVLVHRADYRARMRMDLDVGAEVASAVVLVVSIWIAARSGAGVEGLVACYALSRAAYLAIATALAGPRPPAPVPSPERGGGRALVVAALPLGLAGLLAAGYDAIDAMALSRWSTDTEVGIFSAASRLLMLAVIAVQAIGLAVFPVLSAQWGRDREAFTRTMQAALDSSMVLGGAAICALYGGALGVAGFFKQEPAAIAAVLQLLAWAMLARVVVTIMGPMVVVCGRQLHTVWLTALVFAAKALALALLVPPLGAMGAAWACLAAEVGVSVLPTIWVCQRVAGVRLQWSVAARALGCAAAVALAVSWSGIETALWQGAAAAGAFLALAAATGALRVADLRTVLGAVMSRRGAGAQAVPPA
jgi:O-antigen/teichoic acid export membrane protein